MVLADLRLLFLLLWLLPFTARICNDDDDDDDDVVHVVKPCDLIVPSTFYLSI